MCRFLSEKLIKMEKAIEVLEKELKSIEYLYANYERANILQHIDVDGMQKRIDALKYTIDFLKECNAK